MVDLTMPMLSRRDVQLCVRDRKSLYHAMVANGYVVPALKSNLCTIEFMYKVQAQQVWLPKVSDMHDFRTVNRPPPRTYLMGEITLALRDVAVGLPNDDAMVDQLANLQAELELRHGNIPFLVQLLYSLNTHHEIFAKNYAYYRVKKRTHADSMAVLPNPDSFYDGLPQLPVSMLRKKGLRLSKNMRLQIMLAQAQDAQAAAESRMHRARALLREAGQEHLDTNIG